MRRANDMMIRCVKPGGKIEVSEGRTTFTCSDGTWTEDSYMRKWQVCIPNPNQPRLKIKSTDV